MLCNTVGLTGRCYLSDLCCGCVSRCRNDLALCYLCVTAKAVGVACVAVGSTGFFCVVTNLGIALVVLGVESQLQVFSGLSNCVGLLLKVVLVADRAVVMLCDTIGLTGRCYLSDLRCGCVSRCRNDLAMLQNFIAIYAVNISGMAGVCAGGFIIIPEFGFAYVIITVQLAACKGFCALCLTNHAAYVILRKILTGRCLIQIGFFFSLCCKITAGKFAVGLHTCRAGSSCKAGSNTAAAGFPVLCVITAVYCTFMEMEFLFRSPDVSDLMVA